MYFEMYEKISILMPSPGLMEILNITVMFYDRHTLIMVFEPPFVRGWQYT